MFEDIENITEDDGHVPEADVELEFPPVSQKTDGRLADFAPLKADDYETFKEDFLNWMLTIGKNPKKGNGYAKTTTRTTHYKIDQFYRWLWNANDEGYTTTPTEEQATSFISIAVKNSDFADTEILTFEKAIKRLFKYLNEVKGYDYDWDHDFDLQQTYDEKSNHYFKKHELSRLYDAAIELSSFKSYHSDISPDERDALKAHLAQRFGKPKYQVGPDDFERANSWKWPSILALSFDAGLRPKEIEKSKMSWLDLPNNQIIIPPEEATKNDSPWTIPLSNRTVKALQHWLDERGSMEKYQSRNEIWLTKYGNPYDSTSLNRKLKDFIDHAGIEANGRKLTWYAIRRGVATIWANEESTHDLRQQLRQNSVEMALRYSESSTERRADKINSKW